MVITGLKSFGVLSQFAWVIPCHLPVGADVSEQVRSSEYVGAICGRVR